MVFTKGAQFEVFIYRESRVKILNLSRILASDVFREKFSVEYLLSFNIFASALFNDN